MFLTTSVGHAVEEDPRVRFRAIFDKGHIVAGLDAKYSKQLHGVPEHRCVCICICRKRYCTGKVTAPRRVAVHLKPKHYRSFTENS